MRTMGRGSCVLCIFAVTALAGCGVGTWHIPNVPPVVKPEPEEDIFADMNLEEEEPAKTETDEGAKPEADPKPESDGDAKP